MLDVKMMFMKNQKIILVILVVSLLIFVGMKFFSSFSPSFVRSASAPEGFSDSGSSNGEVATVKFFFANWCKYCQRAKPIYEQVKQSMNGQTIKGKKLQFEEIDCTDPTLQTEALLDQFYVKEYPTIKMVVNNNVYTFEKQVTSNNLQEFIQSHL